MDILARVCNGYFTIRSEQGSVDCFLNGQDFLNYAKKLQKSKFILLVIYFKVSITTMKILKLNLTFF